MLVYQCRAHPAECCRTVIRTLGDIADKTPGVELRQTDITSLALAQGFGHAASLSIVFCWSWLPLALGKGVLYTDRCHLPCGSQSPTVIHMPSIVAKLMDTRQPLEPNIGR